MRYMARRYLLDRAGVRGRHRVLPRLLSPTFGRNVQCTLDVREHYLGKPAQDGFGIEGAAVGAVDFGRFFPQYQLDAFL